MDSTVETTELLEIDPQPEPGGEPTDKPAAPQADKPAKPTREAELERALKSERRARREAETAARFWGEQARTTAKPAKAEEAAEEAEPTLSVDLVDALTNGDHKAVKKALREMGFASKDEVEAAIAKTRAQVTNEAALLQKYPFLGEEGSEAFKRTGEIYNELAADPSLKGSSKLVEIAARMVAAELGETPARRSKPASRPVVDIDDDDDFDDDEQDRIARVSRQSGDRGRRPTRDVDGDRGDELDAMQKSIVQRLRAAGADIDEEKYAKRARAGIRMGGLPTVRRRR